MGEENLTEKGKMDIPVGKRACFVLECRKGTFVGAVAGAGGGCGFGALDQLGRERESE